MSDIFISYARSTEPKAKQISDQLTALGYSVWRDDSLPAHKAYADVIEAELDAAKVVLVIWSADAVKSEWVRSEADRARNRRKLLQVTVDGTNLPMPFDQIQCVDLSAWSGSPDVAAWRTVVASVAALTGSGPTAEFQRSTPQSDTASEPVLAVLPFDNLSSDSEMQFFSDGVSEDIIQRLSRCASLKLIGRTSSFQFRDDRKAEAAQVLNCSHVLDGSIRRAANRVRVSAQLLEASSQTMMWSDRYDRSLEDIFAVQDEISESIAAALDQTFSAGSSHAVDPELYDLYLRASLRSYAPDELRTNIGLLEIATKRAPDFSEAWARLAYLRAWLRFYQPYSERADITSQVLYEADKSLELDAHNVDALVARLFVIAPFGDFINSFEALQRVREAPGTGDGKKYIGWSLRNYGFVKEALIEDELTFRIDPLDPMCANVVALARMAAGKVAEAVPVYEDLVERVPDMSFPVTSLLRAKALLEDWEGLDRLLEQADDLPMREFEEGLAFIRAKRHPTRTNIDKWQQQLAAHVSNAGFVDVSRLVYAAHLGLADYAYSLADSMPLGPVSGGGDIMGPDAYRTSMLFQVCLPEIREDERFVKLCARLGLVDFWMHTDRWPDCVDEMSYDFRGLCEESSQIARQEFGC